MNVIIFCVLFFLSMFLLLLGWWRLGSVKVFTENGYNYEFFVKDRSSFKFFFFYPVGEENLKRLSDEDFNFYIEYCENDSSNWRCNESYGQEKARRESAGKH